VKDAALAGSEDSLSEVMAPHDAFRIALPNFEGPLDLLLHLIREHKVDILDIPIALITEKYLEHLDKMREIDLDIAGEFLVMASTLLHLKSRLLLPREEVAAGEAEAAEAAGDPRAELVRRLLEYQKYKDAAEQLARQDLLDRNVFPRRVQMERVPFDPEEIGLAEISVYKLIEALDRVLKALEPKMQHEVFRERLSLSDAIHKLAEKLRINSTVSFSELFEGAKVRSTIIITFLGLLEMCKLKLVRIFQVEDTQEIRVSARGDALASLEVKALKPEELERDFQ
jgi:segregation and condensation protein A